MKRFLSISVAFLLAGVSIDAQTYSEAIAANRDLAAYSFTPYKPQGYTDTPAPKGYEPIYMSHYGRHGSRYHTSDSYFKRGLEGFAAAKESDLLTPTGIRLMEDFTTIAKAHDGMDGQLSPLGAREHRGIASRLYERNKKLFNSKSRKFVRCISSPIQRCIISMTNFATALNDKNPDLDFSYDTGERYFRYICKEVCAIARASFSVREK